MFNIKYVKKPVVIEAVKLECTDESILQVMRFIGGFTDENYDSDNAMQREALDSYIDQIKKKGLYINTLEGEIKASIGDFIIKGVKGEFYPCKPDIFEMTYELFND